MIREFEIIGEAINHLLKRNIVDIQYRRIVDFRNQITHGYFGIDPEIVWEIINQKLDDLESVIVELIQKIEPKLREELIDSYIEDNNYLDFVEKALEQLRCCKL